MSSSLDMHSLECECKKDIFYFGPKISFMLRRAFLFFFFFLPAVVFLLLVFFLPPPVCALVRFFLDCRLRLQFTVVLYPEPFIISDILSAAFLLMLRPDSLARDFTASLKLTPLLATSSTTFIPARSVSLLKALAPLVTYGRMRWKRPPNQAPTPRPLRKVEPAKTFLTPPPPICSS